MAGRPQVWTSGSHMIPGSGEITSSTADEYVSLSGWAGSNTYAIRCYDYDESIADEADRWLDPGKCWINCNNYRGTYAFHPGGANVLFVDGSVHLLSETIAGETMAALLTVKGQEVVGEY